MNVCPRCRTPLERRQTQQGFHYVCPACQGRAVALPVLRRLAGSACVNGLWRQASVQKQADGLPCPVCQQASHRVTFAAAIGPIELDLCSRCSFVWFDAAELAQIPRAASPGSEDQLPAPAREAIALQRLDSASRMAQATRGMGDEDPPGDLSWNWIPALLGMPVEVDRAAVEHCPGVTWGTAAVLAAVFLLTAGVTDRTARDWGMVPADCWRHGGLTWLTCFFLHAGPVHLFGNAYFLLVFGRHVEDCLGRARYLLLLLAATVLAGVAHVAGNADSVVPCVGASGGISGVIMFYALRFPDSRLGLFFRWGFFFRWVTFPAWVGIVFWIGMQILTSFLQLHGLSNVAGLAHLGGAAAGLGAWAVHRALPLAK